MRQIFHSLSLLIATALLTSVCYADSPSLAKNNLELATTTTINATTLSADPILLTPTSSMKSIVKKVQNLSQGAGLFGKKIKTVIRKDLIGFQYTTQW